MRRNHQRNIERSRQRGLTVTMECGAGALAEFEEIYRESMDRVGADDYYYFPPSYFQELRRVLEERLWICTARLSGGNAVASILLVECGPIVQYHLGGTRTAALALAPTKLLIDHGWRWAKARGCSFFHLGGGVGCAEDPLFDFKAGFSDRHLPFCTWQVVFLDDAYRALQARRHGLGPPVSRPEFFPSYRA
jgi:lipid II:glycine glycyltransferase (peptidoglycan interpeptide bridge formation enzyme)